MTNPQALIQRAQAQTQANRFAFLLKQMNQRLADKIAKMK
jgi:hypothetical protein